MISLTTQVFDKEEILYDGTQLSPHFLYRRFDLLGDALVAFTGPADVSLSHMVDLEDVKKKAPIYSPRMLHFLGEFFLDSLDMGVLLQHLFTGAIYEVLWENGVTRLSRRGNDIYYEGRKLSVSIATKSSVSVLLHAGLNIDTEGTPVPTAGLREMKVEPLEFARLVFTRFTDDNTVWRKARAKVQPRNESLI